MRNQSKGGLKKLLMVVSALSMLFTLSACSLDEYGTYEDLQYDEGKSFAENTKTGGNGNVSSATAISTSAGEDFSRYFPDGVIRDKKVTPKGNGEDTVTILVFMNGSNLESEDSEATTDLSEMVAAGSSEKVNIIVQTMGTKKWDKKFGIAPDRSLIYKVEGNGLTLLKDDIGQQDCTAEKTLSDFIIWGAQNYPADRYALLFWNHGGGPVYGFGYDEWNSDENAALTIDEMQSAMKRAGVYFDFVGMDCCLMSCLEVCCAFYDYCDYMVLSEDFESGLGWEYTSWLKALYKNTSMDTVELGRMICDSMVEANETQEGGDKSSMTVIDMSVLKVLYAAWTDFAYANESALLGTNFSRPTKRVLGGRTLPRLSRNDRPYGWSFDFFGLDEYGEEDEENLSKASSKIVKTRHAAEEEEGL